MIIENVKGLTKVSDDSLDIVTGGGEETRLKKFTNSFIAKLGEGLGSFLPQIMTAVVSGIAVDAAKKAIFDKKEPSTPESERKKRRN